MDDQAKFDQIVENLYAGTFDSAVWRQAIVGMADFLGCSSGILFAANPITGLILRDELSRGDAAQMQEYRQHWVATDIRIAAGMTCRVGVPQYERQLIAKNVWENSALLNEFLVPSDAPFMLATWLHKSPHKMVALTFQGSRRRGPFDENDGAEFKRLIPHVQRALDIRDRLEASEIRASTLSSVVEQSHRGIIILDEKGRILEATGLAERLLKTECGMRRASDHALWLREPAGSQLRQWVMTGLPPKDNLRGCLSVPRGGGLQSISLVVTPMPDVRVAWTNAEPRWLVFVFDPEQRVLPSAHLVSHELGISAREGEIAVLLSLGHTLSGVAMRLGISLHTVRVHLKHIFEKTGAHSQSELIRRVLLSPAMHFSGKH
jgi:DNA-binding CsgD family transcriptional regulator/PAS domain-containing protein